MTKLSVLAVGAHADDLDALCGGTLARYAAEGQRVTMCVVTDGRAHPPGDPERISAIRRAEAQGSADLIGAELVWMGVRDGELFNDLPTRRQMVDVIRAAAPDLVITHSPDDYHPDHNTTHQLVIDAIQPAGIADSRSAHPPIKQAVPVALMPTVWGINFVPEEYVDITPVWETKVKMIMQHRSQHRHETVENPDLQLPPPEQLFLVRAVRVMAEFYGLACSVPYAETFRWWRAADRSVPRRLLP